MHYMNHNKTTKIVNDKEKIQNDDDIIGQNKQLTNGNRSQEYPHVYKKSYDFYNNGYFYPFMQPASLCSPYQMPFYHQQYPYHQMPKCISHSQAFQMAGSLSDLIKKEEMAEIVKIQSSQNESRNKIAPLQKKQRKCRKAKARKQQLKIKRKCTKRQQQIPILQKNLQGYKLPSSIQEQQDLLQLFIQIINIFINQEYSTMTKQKWITCFKSRFQNIQVDPIFNLLTILQFKFEHLKKTKEEFIKYIIRKIYHNLSADQQKRGKPQYSRLQQFHLKNLVSHGTMNFLFLRKQFSNTLFVKLYMEFVTNMDEIMEQDNQKRIERYGLFILECWKQYELYKLYDQRKMPWLKSYSKKTANLCLDLLKKHGSSSDLQTYYKIRGEQQ